jgi:hypothetical protein
MQLSSNNAQSVVAGAGLDDPRVAAVLRRLHHDARRDLFILAQFCLYSCLPG